jgi:hypothetical protein
MSIPTMYAELGRPDTIASSKRGPLEMAGIVIFKSLREALNAGYMLESPVPDKDGFMRARIMLQGGWAKALVRTSTRKH